MTTSTPLGTTSLHLCVKHPVVAACACACACVGYLMTAGTGDTRYVAITFDDGFASDHAIALTELKERDMIATSFINPGSIGSEGRMTTEQLHDLQTAGWEIGSHGMNHIDYATSPKVDALYDLVDATVWFAVNDLGAMNAFASPFGAYNQDVLDMLAKHFPIHVNAWSDMNGVNTRHNVDPMNFHREDFRNTSLYEICNKLDGIGDNTVYTILFHEIVSDDQASDYKTARSDFIGVLECIEQAGLKTVTISQGVEYLIDGKVALQ